MITGSRHDPGTRSRVTASGWRSVPYAQVCDWADPLDTSRCKVRLAEMGGRNYHGFRFVGPPGRSPPEHLGRECLARRRDQGARVRQVSSRSLRMTSSGWLSSMVVGVILSLQLCVPEVFLSAPRGMSPSDPASTDPANEEAESPEDVVMGLGARSLCLSRGRSSRKVPPDARGLRHLSGTWLLAAANRSRIDCRSPDNEGGLGKAGGRTPRRWIESQRC